MIGNRARAAARERVEQLCASTLDERALRVAILTELRRAIGFDAYAWLLTDPTTTVGWAPLADVPCLAELPTLIKLKYSTSINRWTDLAAPHSAPVRLLQHSTGGDLARSLMWRNMLREHHIIDVASAVFNDRHGCWAFLDLWRANGRRGFDDQDVALLTDLTAIVARALRQRQARTFAAPGSDASGAEGPAMLLLDDDLRIVSQTAAATAWLRKLLPTYPGAPPVPAAAYNVAAQLLAGEAGTDVHPAAARTHVAGLTWVTLRASRFIPTGQPASAAIGVTIEQTSASQRVDLFARSHALTPRERQLLRLIAQGLDTHELATTMLITEHTIQDHLKAIFAKTSITTRRMLTITVLGSSQDDLGL